MPKYMTLSPHLTNEELEKRYRKARDGVDRSQWQIIWLLAQGKHSGEVAAITGYRVGWIRALVRRYNVGGPERIGDQRHHNPGQSRLLTAAQEQELKALLEQAQAAGQSWTGPQVARWMSQQLGRPIHAVRGWEVMRRLGFTAKTPRPRHAKADAEQQRWFKKTSPTS
jgi:transposase